MPQTIPLRTALRVKRPRIIMDNPRFFLVHVLRERLPAEEGGFDLEIERGVEGDAHAGADFRGRGGDGGGGLTV